MENFEIMEKALLHQEQIEDNPYVCKALAELYLGQKPLSARAYATKAVRLGAKGVTIPVKTAAECRETDLRGSYIMAVELYHQNRYEEAATYLETVARSGDKTFAPMAALFLADMLSYHYPLSHQEIRRWYQLAAKLGNPDTLSVPKKRVEKQDDFSRFFPSIIGF